LSDERIPIIPLAFPQSERLVARCPGIEPYDSSMDELLSGYATSAAAYALLVYEPNAAK
jgi:hypothetical protein